MPGVRWLCRGYDGYAGCTMVMPGIRWLCQVYDGYARYTNTVESTTVRSANQCIMSSPLQPCPPIIIYYWYSPTSAMRISTTLHPDTTWHNCSNISRSVAADEQRAASSIERHLAPSTFHYPLHSIRVSLVAIISIAVRVPST